MRKPGLLVSCRNLSERSRANTIEPVARPDHQDAEHESEIADAVGDERLVGGGGRGVACRTNGRSADSELTPTSSQKMNIITKLFASTMPSIENMKSESAAK